MPVDYYAILDLESGADDAEIKKAFRKKAKKYHPDVNKADSANEQFKRVYTAYEVLSDPYKKKLYDEIRKDQGYSGEESYHGSESSFEQYDHSGFSEWEKRASEKAKEYADMRYQKFRKQDMSTSEFIYQQLGLFLSMSVLFLVGGAALYFAQSIIIAVILGKITLASLLGAAISIAFGMFLLYQVLKMAKVFSSSFYEKFGTQDEKDS